jgi:hypothetical protein
MIAYRKRNFRVLHWDGTEQDAHRLEKRLNAGMKYGKLVEWGGEKLPFLYLYPDSEEYIMPVKGEAFLVYEDVYGRGQEEPYWTPYTPKQFFRQFQIKKGK